MYLKDYQLGVRVKGRMTLQLVGITFIKTQEAL